MMFMKYKQRIAIKNERVKIAKERIEILKRMIKEEPEFANRYKELIDKLIKKYRLQKSF